MQRKAWEVNQARSQRAQACEADQPSAEEDAFRRGKREERRKEAETVRWKEGE